MKSGKVNCVRKVNSLLLLYFYFNLFNFSLLLPVFEFNFENDICRGIIIPPHMDLDDERNIICGAPDKSYAKKHPLFLEANRVVRRPSIFGYDNAWGSADEVEAYAKRYMEDVTNKTLVLINHEHQKIKYLPYKTRFDDEYAKRIARKWKKIGYTEGIFLTLTLNPNRFSSLHQAYTGMIEGWNKIVTAIRKRYPNFIGYVRVVEFQKSGNPHLHIMLFGVDFVPVEWIRELWENHYGLGTQINVKRITNDKGLLDIC